LVAQTSLAPSDLVLPLFVKEGIDEVSAVTSMPGVYQHTVDSLRKAANEAVESGVGGLLLFGIPSVKDGSGSQADADEGIVNRALRALRSDLGDSTVLIADLCLCEYTDHGHCGLLGSDEVVDNDATLVRYASAFYGPFRDAAEGAPQFGDRAGYQMDPANSDEALREVAQDLAEGADAIIVKPALPYLDIVSRVADAVHVPVAGYQVSGEYAMIEAAAERGWVDRDRAILETVTGIRRAGADIVITYWAAELARRLARLSP